MDIRDHLNLIDNHGYKGHIAIYCGPELMTARHGDIVLVQHEDIPEPDHNYSDEDVEWMAKHRTIEKPHTEVVIQSYRKRGNLTKTHSCCVAVPRGYMRPVRHLWMYRTYYWVISRLQSLIGRIDRYLFT